MVYLLNDVKKTFFFYKNIILFLILHPSLTLYKVDSGIHQTHENTIGDIILFFPL